MEPLSPTSHSSAILALERGAGDRFVFAPAFGAGDTPWTDLITGFGGGRDRIRFEFSSFGASNATDAWKAPLASVKPNFVGRQVVHDVSTTD
jgi:hypothetical protein